MLRPFAIVLTVAALPAAAAEPPEAARINTTWGSIHRHDAEGGIFDFAVEHLPADGRLDVPTPFPNIVRCAIDGRELSEVDFEFDADASHLTLLLPNQGPTAEHSANHVRVETCERSRQFSDGRIVFSALDAEVAGRTAKLETHPGNHRVGFWTNADDSVTWGYKATRWGMYDVLLTYSTASADGGRVAVEMSSEKGGSATVEGTLASTGSWYRYRTINLGKMYLEKAGKYTLTVRCLQKVGLAVMNLKAVILAPACEGTPPVQAADGVVTLHGRDATIHGTVLRWEPVEKKQTIGYWIRPSDAAVWDFTLNEPGAYDVEVWQGCGPGQGGSRMLITGPREPITWVVEETGHFQNFKPRIAGRLLFDQAGTQRLTVRPAKIAAKAACDIRQIRLIPVKE